MKFENRVRFLRAASLLLSCVFFVNAASGWVEPAYAATDPTDWSTSFSNGDLALSEEKLDLAEQNFRAALKSARASAHNPGDVEKCMGKLAKTLSLRGKLSEAQRLYQELLSLQTKRFGADNKELVPALIALGSLQESAGDHAAAFTYYKRALKINEQNYGPYSPALLGNLQGLARSARASGNVSAADEHGKRAAAILSQNPGLEAANELEAITGNHNKDLIKTNENSDQQLIQDFQKKILDDNLRAPIPATNQDGAESSSWQKESDQRTARRLSWQTNDDSRVALRGLLKLPSDKDLAPAYNVMSNTLLNEDHYGKGEQEYQRVIAIDINALGQNHPSVANDLTGLARLYIKQNRYADAVPLLEKALKVYDEVYGLNNALSIKTCADFASAQFRIGNIDKASTLYRRALSQPNAVLQPNSTETARILNELAYLYFKQSRLQDAVTFYQWALASTEGAMGEQNPLTAACLKDYAQVLRKLGRADEASTFEARASNILAIGDDKSLLEK